MRKALEALIELQDIDWKLKKLLELQGDLPQKVESLATEAITVNERLINLKNELAEKQHKSRTLTSDVDAYKESLKKYQLQLYQVKNNKEYDAITVEIDETQEKIDKSEYEILEIEEANQNIEAKISETEDTLKNLNEMLEENKKELATMLAKTKDEESGLAKQRVDVLVDLPRPILNHYERIRKGRGGTAISLLREGACTGCSSKIPPQRALEIRTMNEMHLCETCGRILVWREDLDVKPELSGIIE